MKNLQRIRKEKGLTQKELADASSVKIGTIKKYESGEKDINQAAGMILYHLAKVLGCSMEDLLEIEKEGDN